MLDLKNKDMCSGCTACAEVCPKNCIAMIRDKMGFAYPVIEKTECINCGLCEKICPELNDVHPESADSVKAYAVFGRDKYLRVKSSSGGVFSLIARYVLSEGGVVFGVAFDDGFRTVKHIVVDNLKDLTKIQGSKYIQSYLGNTYSAVKAYLEQGKEVLFTGTPCQIDGLKSFLKKDYEKLYLQDIVCHGVPSPAVWSAYLENLENKYGGKTQSVSFRDKSAGWKNYLLNVEFDNGKSYSCHRSKELFMRGFLHDYYLRPSCYNCKHKGLNRSADITLADYWGIEKVHPEMDDDKGCSLVFVGTAKGKLLLEKIGEYVVARETDKNLAIKFNPSVIFPAKDNPKRKKFEVQFEYNKTSTLLKKYCSVSLYKKLVSKLKSFISK